MHIKLYLVILFIIIRYVSKLIVYVQRTGHENDYNINVFFFFGGVENLHDDFLRQKMQH